VASDSVEEALPLISLCGFAAPRSATPRNHKAPALAPNNKQPAARRITRTPICPLARHRITPFVFSVDFFKHVALGRPFLCSIDFQMCQAVTLQARKSCDSDWQPAHMFRQKFQASAPRKIRATYFRPLLVLLWTRMSGKNARADRLSLVWVEQTMVQIRQILHSSFASPLAKVNENVTAPRPICKILSH